MIILSVTFLAFMILYTGIAALLQSPKLLSTGRLAMEASIVGLGLVAIFFPIHAAYMARYGKDAMVHHGLLGAQIFLAGALFHGLWEITTGNHAYCAARV